MPVFACLPSGCGRSALPLALVVLLLPAPAARAQRLLTLVSGVGEAAAAGAPASSFGPPQAAVQVDLGLLRGAPAWLEVPTPDGGVLSAERSVFEDRGGGDLMWSGGQRDAGYDTVVLTVEGGRLVGRFGAAGGGVYGIRAERDGRGGMARIGQPGSGPEGAEPFCGVEAAERAQEDLRARGASAALGGDSPGRVSNPQSHDRLDILVAYTATAAENWADRGGALAAIRHAGDYLKMVFRNNEIAVEPRIVHIAQASAVLDHTGRDLGLHEFDPGPSALMEQIERDGELRRLRHEHSADLVHLFTGERPVILGGGIVCGAHYLLTKGSTAQSYSGSAYGWTENHPFCGDYAATFAHEIGHGLGANHDPHNVSSPKSVIRPYAFGHANLDAMPSIGTAMSYRGQIEPFFSTPRIRPWGAVVGVAGERDNERTLQETVHLGVQYSDYLRSLEGVPAPPSDLRVRFDDGAAHLSWRDNAPDADGYEVEYRTEGVARGVVSRVDGRTGAVLLLEIKEPGTRYDFWVRATRGEARSLHSSIVRLVVPGEPIEAPSGVSATVDPGLDRVEVRWADNSDNEWGFEVQLLTGGEPISRNHVPPDSVRTELSASRMLLQGGAEYGVRVLAYSSWGYSGSSEVSTFRWTHPSAPEPVTGVSVRATGPTTARLTWTDNPESDFYFVQATLRGWRDRFLVSAGAGSVDIDGLARGGRYRFKVRPANTPSSFSSDAYLTLAERGAGPQAPSDISLASSRVDWKDNSNDELGFEVQARWFASDTWERLATVPPGAESVLSQLDMTHHFVRVLAYNERGFSTSSTEAPGLASVEYLTATAGDAEVCLGWVLVPSDWATGAQVRWKPTAEMPFDDAVDTWMDLPASLPEYIATGLENGTEYTFAMRAVTAAGTRRVATATATPGAESNVSFRLDVPCEEELCRTRTDAPVSFVDTSGGSVTERQWTFGDGAGSALRSPTHSWSSPGFYTVTLTVSAGSSSGSATRKVLVAAAAPAGSCRTDAETLCLLDSRFEVKMDWWTASGESGPGRVVHEGTNDSGLFAFFNPENWEVLIKVLDACAINQRAWVLGASTTDLGYRIRVTDTANGESRSYMHEPGRAAPAIVDTDAFAGACDAGAARGATSVETTGGGASSGLTVVADGSAPVAVAKELLAGGCVSDATVLCLWDRDFAVQVDAYTAKGERYSGRVVPVSTQEAGLFFFFDAKNWEVLVKVLDGCAINGHYWVFGASATDLRFELRVQRMSWREESWPVRGYIYPPRLPILETEAFPCVGAARAH